jgi:hypothetical protein
MAFGQLATPPGTFSGALVKKKVHFFSCSLLLRIVLMEVFKKDMREPTMQRLSLRD